MFLMMMCVFLFLAVPTFFSYIPGVRFSGSVFLAVCLKLFECGVPYKTVHCLFSFSTYSYSIRLK